MKKNYIVKLSVFIFVLMLLFASCNKTVDNKNKVAHEPHDPKQKYTCPMHPQVVLDKPGSCPICGMELVPKHTPGTETTISSDLKHLLKPVNEQVVSNISTIKPELSTKIFSMQVQGSITYDTRNQTSIASRVSGRVERLLIKYNYQPVKKGQLIMEIYSPDLAAAQRELLFIYQSDKNDNMMQKAKERLQLLGMQQIQIQHILNTGKILYRIPVYSNASGYILDKSTASNTSVANVSTPITASTDDGMGSMGSNSASSSSNSASTASVSPVLLREGQYVGAGESLFTIYTDKSLIAEFALDPSASSQIKQGQKLVFHESSDKQSVYTGTIGLIQPVFKAGSNFTMVRVYLNDNKFQIGKLVTATIPIVSKGWWVPQSAVLNLGNKSILFKKEQDVFIPREIKTKITTNGMVLIEQDISDWNIASNAAYLVDSESFIKIASENKLKK